MPAVMITNVIPTDSVSATEALMKIDLMLYEPRNALGFMIEKTTMISDQRQEDPQRAGGRQRLAADSRASDASAAGGGSAAVVGRRWCCRSPGLAISSRGSWLTARRPR